MQRLSVFLLLVSQNQKVKEKQVIDSLSVHKNIEIIYFLCPVSCNQDQLCQNDRIFYISTDSKQMKSQEQQISSCSFCEKIPQLKELLAIVLLRLKKEKKKYYDQHFPLVLEGEGQSFRQLLSIVFSHEIKLNSECQHTQLYKLMLKKLKCSPQYFSFLCDKVAGQMGQRNYQLQILASQIKNVAETLEQGKVELDKGKKDSIQKLKSGESEIKEGEVKEQNQEVEECSIERQGNQIKIESEPLLREIQPNIRSIDTLSKFQSPETQFPLPPYGYSFPYLYHSYHYFLPPKE